MINAPVSRVHVQMGQTIPMSCLVHSLRAVSLIKGSCWLTRQNSFYLRMNTLNLEAAEEFCEPPLRQDPEHAGGIT